MSILDQHAEMYTGGHYDESTSDYKVQGIFYDISTQPLNIFYYLIVIHDQWWK